MKATAKSPRIPVIEIVLVLIAIGLTGFVFWYIQHTNRVVEKTLSQADASSQTALVRPPQALVVAQAALPTGWQVEKKDKGLITLVNQANDCYAETIVRAREPAQTVANYQQQTVSGIKAKGYAVRNLGTTSQPLQAPDGLVNLPASNYRVSLAGDDMFQSYGVAVANDQLLTTQVSCPKQSDLTAASAVLQAITVNRKLTY